MADSPHRHRVPCDLVTDAIVTHPDLPKANQRAPEPFAISGRLSHQAGLDRPDDARTEIPRHAREIFGGDFWPVHHRIAVAHRLPDPEPSLDFCVWDRTRRVLPPLLDDLFQGGIFQQL